MSEGVWDKYRCMVTPLQRNERTPSIPRRSIGAVKRCVSFGCAIHNKIASVREYFDQVGYEGQLAYSVR